LIAIIKAFTFLEKNIYQEDYQMIKIETLENSALEKIKTYRYDQILEKHEGPEYWNSIIQYHEPEFMEINGKSVLLPINRKHHKNISILRVLTDEKEKTLTIFLKDITFVENPDDETFFAGFLAICEKVPDETFYIAIVYHEWFIIDEHINDL
jgi:hypothetical protein